MMHKIVLYLFLASALFGQFNHQEKLGIKRKLGQSTVTFDFDGRTNETGFFHKHLDIGIHYSFKPTWTVGLKYRAQYRTKNNEWHLEQRPQGELIKVVNSQKLKWEFRTRMDYRIREGKNDEMRNRSRIQLKALNPISLLKITPFISNEFFFAPKSWNYYINWTAIGFDLPKTKIGKPTIFYKYVQSLNDHIWTPTYTMVFKLTI